MDPKFVLVFPDEVFGPFASHDDAKEYLNAMYNFDADAVYLDHKWSIKPLISP